MISHTYNRLEKVSSTRQECPSCCDIEKLEGGQMLRYMPTTPALGWLKKENHDPEAGLNYTERLCLKTSSYPSENVIRISR